MVFGKSFFEVSIFCTAFWCLQKDLFQKIIVFSFWPLDHNLCIFGTCRNYCLCSLDPGESTGNNYSITWVTKKILTQEKHIFLVLPKSNVDEAKNVGFDPKMSKFMRFFILTVPVIWAFSLLQNTSDGFQTPLQHDEQNVWSLEMCLHTHNIFRRCLEVSLEVSEMILKKFGFDPKMSKFLRFFILTVSVIWAFSLLLNTSDGFQTPPKHNEQKVWSREMCLHTHKTFRRCLEVSETSKRKYRQNVLMLHLW